MHLILSSRHPRNSRYHTEAGQVLYKVDKPRNVRSSIATIRKAINTSNGVCKGNFTIRDRPPLPDRHHLNHTEREKDEVPEDIRRRSVDSHDAPFADSDSEDEVEPRQSMSGSHVMHMMEGHFAFYAQVEFHSFSSTRFRYNSLDVSVSEYFRKEGWSWFGRGRVFKASDGGEYRWDLRAGHLEMIKNDGSKKRVVRFREHRPSLGPLMKGRPASLEVDDSCIPILDEIVMTFIYCEKLRKDRETQSRHSAAAGGN
ncbi:hypothetical protein AGABI2DRAFT_176960 [Agaricus bisporus var. bisporus H97]|uniref:hypothetical protein n=1 Tax=Agaricus bisporus var. bisporus (strain H97 / ATCC MYA-4626 / FGSC 10389) TaxID=936046 RepID=UPI00029F7EF4|nr:hypothetical protein AGABI2DRAFT_176960 [Agaricus bisporus var. bisporus H97]EKV50689.1 hypothetical protein AGABI2DRAFT_176960 [Agaricus bisporus var. bisporus H97]